MIFSTKQLHFLILCTFSGFGEMGGRRSDVISNALCCMFTYSLIDSWIISLY